MKIESNFQTTIDIHLIVSKEEAEELISDLRRLLGIGDFPNPSQPSPMLLDVLVSIDNLLKMTVQ